MKRYGRERTAGLADPPARTIFGRVRPLRGRLARAAISLALAVALGGALAAAPATAAADPTALLIFRDAAPAEVRALVTAAGARVVALFPAESSALVAGPEAALAALTADPRVAAGSQGALTGEEVPALPEPQRLAAAAWNRLKAPPQGPLAAAPDGEPLIHDAIEPPPAVTTRLREPADESGLDGRPYGARWDNTSEFLAGTVSLTVFLLECDGSIDPMVRSVSRQRSPLRPCWRPYSNSARMKRVSKGSSRDARKSDPI